MASCLKEVSAKVRKLEFFNKKIWSNHVTFKKSILAKSRTWYKVKKEYVRYQSEKKHHNGRYHDMYLTTPKETLENIPS